MSRLDVTVKDFTKSITGAERGLIARYYKCTFDKLSDGDRFVLVEALAFVDQFRELKRDREAYEAAQALTLAELGDYFADSDTEPVDEDAANDEAGKLARWCLLTGRASSEYLSLDERHRQAFIDQAIDLGYAKVAD